MFESFLLRLLFCVGNLVLFGYLEQQLSIGIVASGIISFALFRSCSSWLPLMLFAIEFALFQTGYKYYSYLPFFLIEIIALITNPVGDETPKVKKWRPYEQEIRWYLLRKGIWN
jgi:hypothetical protein